MPLLLTGLILALGYLVMLFTVLVAWSLFNARRREPPVGANVILVLGAPVSYGQVMPLLASRLHTALKLYGQSIADDAMPDQDTTDPVIVVSGGRPTSSYGTEAKAMARYLIERGVPEDRVVLEEQSATTRENIRFSKDLDVISDAGTRTATGEDVGSGTAPVVVTSDFHVLRTASICRRYGLRATVVGAVSPRGGVRHSVLREYGLLLGEWWPLHIVSAVGIAVVLVALAAQ